jgi:cytoskeletal protein RodZ
MASSFGEYLRQQRDNREISLDQISARTRIQKKFLLALEQGRLDQLPGRTFVRGFIRAYAEALGLNSDQTLVLFEESQKELHPAAAGEKPAPTPEKKRALVLTAILVLVVAATAAVIGLTLSLRQPAPAQKAPGAARSKPVPGQPVPPAGLEKPLPKAPSDLSAPFAVGIKATELCWILATVDGKSSKETMLYPGDSLKLEAAQSLSLLVGNAGGVEITVNSVKLKPIGGHWKPMRFLAPEDLAKYLPAEMPKVETPKPETSKPETPKAQTPDKKSP